MTEAQSATRTTIDDSAHHVEHLQGCSCGKYLRKIGRKGRYHIAVAILDTSHRNRVDTDALVDESTVCRHHLTDRHIGRTESHRDDRVYVALDAEGVEQSNKGIGDVRPIRYAVTQLEEFCSPHLIETISPTRLAPVLRGVHALALAS